MTDRRNATLLQKVANVSAATVYDVLTHPSKLPMLLHWRGDLPLVDGAMRLLPSLDRDTARALHWEFVSNHRFFDEYGRRYVEVRRARPKWLPLWDFVYVVIRAVRPSVVVETGVFDGQSSAVILQALEDNQADGKLVSVDLPAVSTIGESTDRMIYTVLPPDRRPGWVIPDRLRMRHELLLGDSRELLPRVVNENPQIDVFFHDSLHTFDHMTFEFNEAWPALQPNGILLSDDVTWNAAFHRFSKQHDREYVVVAGVGAIRK